MAASVPRYSGFICQLCRAERRGLKKATGFGQHQTRAVSSKTHKPLPSATRKLPSKAESPVRPLQRAPKPLPNTRPAVPPSITPPTLQASQPAAPEVFPPPPRDVPTPTFTLASLVEEGQKVAAMEDAIPPDLEVLELLERCHDYANFVVFGQSDVPEKVEEAVEKVEANTATSSLLDLDETLVSKDSGAAKMPMAARQQAADTLSTLVYDVLRAKNVFITPKMLELFVRVECLLGNPRYLPSIFWLYANKPIPKPGSSPLVYTNPWKYSPKNAVPRKLADAALDAAIAKKDLPLAIAIIDTTVSTEAFRVNKILRRASFPTLAAIGVPALVWSIASRLAEWQVTFDPGMYKFVVMSSSMAYCGTIGVIGFIAYSTWNDHHERVVWRPGTILRERLVREEERAYFDRVAMAWGFKEKWRRGEEQGEEWEALRETIGVRKMMLDASHLLEGME